MTEMPVPYPRIFTDYVIPQLLSWRRNGIPSALVTLVNVDGSSPRKVGSQMAVTIDGDYIGYISSGCAEGAIVAEAVSAIRSSSARTIRYGKNSKFMDVTLPCGSGIDVHFDPLVATEILYLIEESVAARRPARLIMDLTGERAAQTARCAKAAPEPGPLSFVRTYWPEPRLVVSGRGVNVDFVVRIAHQLDWNVIVASPDEKMLERVSPFVVAKNHLKGPNDFDETLVDDFTAVILLYHDHDWEPAILSKCQHKSAFYIGALGSRRTHDGRKTILQRMDVDPAFVDTIHGPAGLNIKANTPPEIALAILSEIVSLVPKC